MFMCPSHLRNNCQGVLFILNMPQQSVPREDIWSPFQPKLFYDFPEKLQNMKGEKI